MRPVEESPALWKPENGPHVRSLSEAVQVLRRIFQQLGFRVNRVLPKDGSEPAERIDIGPTYATPPADPDPVNGRLYVAVLDANNDELRVKLKKGGVVTEVVIA